MIQVFFGLLELFLDFPAFRSSLEELDLENVITLECFGVCLEFLNNTQGLVGKLEAILVVLPLQIYDTDV